MIKQTLRCAAGHEWEWSGDHSHSVNTVTCPQCGQAANTLIPQSDAWAHGQAAIVDADAPSGGGAGDATKVTEHAATKRPAATPSEPWPTIPGYEILAELGRGGMGVVYQARQASLRRTVAIKQLLSGSVERFRLESEAIARLQHPHIVQVYEVGTTARGPYYSQEYIAGGSLADQLDGAPWPAAKAAALVRTLAEAMQFTHDRRIIHRDLKPANILMADDQTPKISDFGLAKESDRDSGQTMTGDIMGSPSYMAPEQAGGVTKNITSAADVYSLGAILYELLTGRPPFYGETAMDTVFQVLSNEPLAPRQLQPKTPRDVETICLKCLEKSPRDRYASAQELADDLRRFLAGEPIHALPVPGWMRAVKWARRRPGLATAIGAATLATLILIVGGVIYNVLLVGALRMADAERLRREKTLVQAQNVVDQLLSGFSEQRLSRLPHSEALRRDLLTSSLQFCEEMQAQNPEQPELRWQVGRAQRQSADLQDLLGHSADAAQSYARSIATLKSLVDEHPAPKYERELAGAHNNLAAMLVQTGRPVEAEAEYRLAIAGFEKLAADHSAAANSAAIDVQRQLARAWDSLGVALLADSRPQDAEDALEKARATLERLAAAAPADNSLRKAQATNFNNLGTLYQQSAELPKAEQLLESSRQMLQDLASAAPDDPEYRFGLASSSANLALVRADTQSADETRAAFLGASELFQRLTEDFPAVEVYRAEWAQTLSNYAAALEKHGEVADAEVQYQRAQRLYDALVAQSSTSADYRARLAGVMRRQGMLALARQDLAVADDLLSRAIDLQTALTKELPNRADYRAELALTCEGAGQLMEARRDPGKARYYFERAIEEQKLAISAARAPDEFKSPLRRQYAALAAALLEVGEPQKAAAAAEQLVALAPDDGVTLVQAASLLTRCIPLVDRFKANLPPTLGEDCGRRAVELLQSAVQRGATLPANLETAAEYEPLRQRPDFRAVADELQKNASDSNKPKP